MSYFFFAKKLSFCMDNQNNQNTNIFTGPPMGKDQFETLNTWKGAWPAWEWWLDNIPNTQAYTIQNVSTLDYLTITSGNGLNCTPGGGTISQQWIPEYVRSVIFYNPLTQKNVHVSVCYFRNMANNQYLQYPTQPRAPITTVSSANPNCHWLLLLSDQVPPPETSKGALDAVVTKNVAAKDDFKSDEKEMELVKYQDMKKRDSNATGYELKGLPNVLANYESMVPNKTDRILMAELAHSKRFDTLKAYFDHLQLNKETHFKAEAVVNHVALHTFGNGFPILGDAATGAYASYDAHVTLTNNTGSSIKYVSQFLVTYDGQNGVPRSDLANEEKSAMWGTQSSGNNGGTSGNTRWEFTDSNDNKYRITLIWEVTADGSPNTNGKMVEKKVNGKWSSTSDYAVNCPTPINSKNTFDFNFTVAKS